MEFDGRWKEGGCHLSEVGGRDGGREIYTMRGIQFSRLQLWHLRLILNVLVYVPSGGGQEQHWQSSLRSSAPVVQTLLMRYGP